MDEDYNYDEGSDIDNYEAEQVFQDREGEGDDDEDHGWMGALAFCYSRRQQFSRPVEGLRLNGAQLAHNSLEEYL